MFNYKILAVRYLIKHQELNKNRISKQNKRNRCQQIIRVNVPYTFNSR